MVMGQGYSNYMGAASAMNPYMMGGAYGMMNPYMMNSYLNFKDSGDMKSYFNTQIDNSQAGLYASGQGRVSQKAYMVAQQLQGALQDKNSTEVGHILESLKKDKYELAGVELAYDQLSGSRAALRQDIRTNLDGSKFMDQIGLGSVSQFLHNVKSAILKPLGYNPMNQRDAIDILNKGAEVNTTVAANALVDATHGLGADSKTVEYVVDHGKGRMDQINASYQAMGGNLSEDIAHSYNPIFNGFASAEKINGRIVNQLI
jgi:hypothetical protein